MMDQLTIVSPSGRPETAMNQHIDKVRVLFEPFSPINAFCGR